MHVKFEKWIFNSEITNKQNRASEKICSQKYNLKPSPNKPKKSHKK